MIEVARCRQCEATFVKSGYGQRFCSIECRNKYNVQPFQIYTAWKNSSMWRKALPFEDWLVLMSKRCVVCGSRGKHIVRLVLSDNYSYDNHTTVCSLCSQMELYRDLPSKLQHMKKILDIYGELDASA